MKKLPQITLLITLIILLFSCSPDPILTPIEPAQSELLGTWNRNNVAWDFYLNGEFAYYNWQTAEIYNYGFYLDDPVDGMFYVEDYISGVSGYYFYYVDGDVLSMAPDFAPGNVTEWGRVK